VLSLPGFLRFSVHEGNHRWYSQRPTIAGFARAPIVHLHRPGSPPDVLAIDHRCPYSRSVALRRLTAPPTHTPCGLSASQVQANRLGRILRLVRRPAGVWFRLPRADWRF
jgi:hypothetical protein